MTTTNDHHSCARKRSFGTYQQALLARKRLWESGTHVSGLRVYRCQVCGFYHLGHSKYMPPDRLRQMNVIMTGNPIVYSLDVEPPEDPQWVRVLRSLL